MGGGLTPAPMKAGDARRPLAGLLGLALLVLCVLLTLREPALPGGDLDSSWALAMEYAGDHRWVFGRDYVFTFGPFAELSTQLYSPRTYPAVLAAGVLSVLAVFAVALRHRSLPALAGITLTFAVLRLPSDSLIPLALFGVFLICLRGDRLWLPGLLLCGPLMLSKLTFGVVLIPLLILADIHRAAARKPPVLTLTLIAATLAALVAAGQPLDALPAMLAAMKDVVLGYGAAMPSTGPPAEVATAIGLSVLAAGFVAGVAFRGEDRIEAAVLALGFCWLMFGLFKMGFVRQDLHTLIFHSAAPGAVAMAFGHVDRPDARPRPPVLVYAAVFLVVLAGCFYWRSVAISQFSRDPAVRPVASSQPDLARDATRVATRLGPRLRMGLDWATGRAWAAMPARRAASEARLARRFPATVTGAVDVIPSDIAPLIASGLDYRPRPVLQSYSAYTPRLQQLDAAHFAGPRAPDTLFLRIEDIDNRLPTLMLGPSLPVIGRRYDAVGRDALGLILRRRAAPRGMATHGWPGRDLPLETWTTAPGQPGRLLMAHIEVRRTLAGRLVGFVFREPALSITLRTAGGRQVVHRFVPDMARLGVGVSPLPAAWPESAAILLDPDFAAQGQPVTALRLSADGAGWAFAGASIRYEEISFAPGFGSALK